MCPLPPQKNRQMLCHRCLAVKSVSSVACEVDGGAGRKEYRKGKDREVLLEDFLQLVTTFVQQHTSVSACQGLWTASPSLLSLRNLQGPTCSEICMPFMTSQRDDCVLAYTF